MRKSIFQAWLSLCCENNHRWPSLEISGQCCTQSLWHQFSVFSWSGSHIRWGQPFRLRHLSTGHYLALTEDRGLVLQDGVKSDTTATAFCFRASKVSALFACINILFHNTVNYFLPSWFSIFFCVFLTLKCGEKAIKIYLALYEIVIAPFVKSQIKCD